MDIPPVSFLDVIKYVCFREPKKHLKEVGMREARGNNTQSIGLFLFWF